MALSANELRKYELGEFNELPVLAAENIFEGSAVGISAGHGRAMQQGDPFAGFAFQQANNTTGANGAIKVRVRRRGTVEAPVTGGSATTIGTLIYLSDDGTFTTTSTSNTLIGHSIRHVAGTTLVIAFDEYRT